MGLAIEPRLRFEYEFVVVGVGAVILVCRRFKLFSYLWRKLRFYCVCNRAAQLEFDQMDHQVCDGIHASNAIHVFTLRDEVPLLQIDLGIAVLK